MKQDDEARAGKKAKGAPGDSRKERLAKALRRNLVLRKERIRAGAETVAESRIEGESADKV